MRHRWCRLGSDRDAGFTLVEVVVVGVIVAVLASIGIVLYTGYVTDARQDTVDQIAQTAAASASAFWRKTNSDPVATDPALEQQLNLFLTDPARFEVTRVNNTIQVTDTRYNVTGTADYK